MMVQQAIQMGRQLANAPKLRGLVGRLVGLGGLIRRLDVAVRISSVSHGLTVRCRWTATGGLTWRVVPT